MNKQYFFLLIAIFLTACTMKQQLHPFPKEASRMITNETCDCDIITFVETSNPITVFDQGVIPSKKTDGHMEFKDGSQQDYSFIKDALYVDEAWNPLRFSVSSDSIGIVKDFISGKTHHTFHGVEQVAELFNPFDGKTYFLFAKFDGKLIRLNISLTPKTPVKAVGQLGDAYVANIYDNSYQMEVVRQWASESENVQGDSEKIWHQYPDGAYIIVANDKGDKIKVFQGVTTGKVLGIDAFTGYKSIVYIPRGISSSLKRDMFLFFYASKFFQDFVDDVENLPACMNKPKDQAPENCNFNFVLK